MVSALVSRSSGPSSSPGARFSKAPETFRARKAIAKSRTLGLFTYSEDEGRFPTYKKFQAYTLLRFKLQMI